MSIWDDPELKTTGNFVKFDKVGDTVSGVVLAVKRHRFDDGNLVPQVEMRCDDGEDRTLTAGQTKLKMALVEQRPDAGDHLTVTLTQIEKRAGGKTLKHFNVKIRRGDGTVPAAAPARSDQPPF
jgi:predicted metal-dependent phosphoesterase TrpH